MRLNKKWYTVRIRKDGPGWVYELASTGAEAGVWGGVDVLVFATMTSVVVELALEEAFSFSCSGDEESAFPITHQLPCFLGIGRSVIGGFVVCAFGFGLGAETAIENRI